MRKFGRVASTLWVLVGSVMGASALTLTSPDVKAGQTIAKEQVFNGFGCSGKNISPALAWSGAPKNTKSFALSVYDPDAPTGSGFWHWVLFDMSPDTTSLARGAGNPESDAGPKGAIEGRTDFGVPGYGGPCPPKGDKPHHYIFTIYAVDVDELDADESTTAAVVGFKLHSHTLEKASLTALYGR
jgi:Raf kinase inhibitor-like YbhB/YbcL family protein